MLGLKNIGHLWLQVRVSYNGALLISGVYEATYNAAKKNPAEAVQKMEKQIRRNARRMIKDGFEPERLIVSIRRLKSKPEGIRK